MHFSKAAELRKEYAEVVQTLVEEDKQLEAQFRRSQQAEAANLEMTFKVVEFAQYGPEGFEQLNKQKEDALSEMFKDIQAQHDAQKAEIKERLAKAKAELQAKQEQLCQLFETNKQEARKEFQDIKDASLKKVRTARRIGLVEAARGNPTTENIYA